MTTPDLDPFVVQVAEHDIGTATDQLAAETQGPVLDSMLLRRVVQALCQSSYRFVDENALHAGLAEAMTAAGIAFEHEVVAGAKDRFDFLLASGIVIEVKTKGSLSVALSQVDRYAARRDVTAVVLVTNLPWGSSNALPDDLHGKPIRLARVSRSSF